jgi:hypothetical protein
MTRTAPNTRGECTGCTPSHRGIIGTQTQPKETAMAHQPEDTEAAVEPVCPECRETVDVCNLNLCPGRFTPPVQP